MTEHEKETRSTGAISSLEQESDDMNFLSFRDSFASFANSLSSIFNILVDEVPTAPDPLVVALYEAGGINAHPRKIHENAVARREEYMVGSNLATGVTLQ